jgi:hypothetical protein
MAMRVTRHIHGLDIKKNTSFVKTRLKILPVLARKPLLKSRQSLKGIEKAGVASDF